MGSSGLICCLLLVLSTSDDLNDYVFVQDTDRLVEVRFGATIRLGHLDKDGKFVPNGKTYQRGQARSSISAKDVGVHLNLFPEKNVYEYRSGRLIKGEINEDGKFIPEKGAKLMDFKDYHFRKDGPRIWNLPGYFEKKVKTS
jgi:hypothetical protein